MSSDLRPNRSVSGPAIRAPAAAPRDAPGYQVTGCEAGQMVGNKSQGRADVGGVVSEQESTDAGQYCQVPVKACGDTRVQLLEDALSRWLRSPGFRYHLAPPRGRLNTPRGSAWLCTGAAEKMTTEFLANGPLTRTTQVQACRTDTQGRSTTNVGTGRRNSACGPELALRSTGEHLCQTVG